MGKNDDKTEKPTPKKRRDARKKGQIAKSQELGGWAVVMVTASVLPSVFRSASTRLTGLFASSSRVMSDPSPASAMRILGEGLRDTGLILLPLLASMMGVALFTNMAQTGGSFSLQAAKPKWDHLNPATGLKRMVSPESAWKVLQQLMRLAVLALLAYHMVSHMGHMLVGARVVAMGPVISYGARTILSLVRDVAGVSLGLAAVDYGLARRRINKALKMTKQEVKDESREQQGDPLVKRNIRRQQYRISRSRMMAAVRTADVVITNPTHYAVALKYNAASRRPPTVVAKGADEVALRIRELAQECSVAVVEDPPLARAVYAACQIDEPIPQELFAAVARLLAFVFTLPTTLRATGSVLRRPTSALVA